MPVHLLDLTDHDAATLRAILSEASRIKSERLRARAGAQSFQPLLGGTIVLLLEKPATRTRVHVEVAARDVGASVIALRAQELQMTRGETIADTARVLSRLCDLIVYRAVRHADLVELATWSEVPVINGLSDRSHPFRILVDIFTYEEARGPIENAKVAWIGDGNNVANTWAQAAPLFGFDLHMATPPGYGPDPHLIAWDRSRGARITLHSAPADAAAGADYVQTDTWVSMGDVEGERRRTAFAGFTVDDAIMSLAAPSALFGHPLPAYRGQEVTASVIDGPQSVVWGGGIENKRYVLQALFAWLTRA
jgi:ornithine carbamoyltransferase